MRPRTSRHRRAGPGRSGARAPRARACRTSPTCWWMRATRWQQVVVPAWYGERERVRRDLLRHRRLAPRRLAGPCRSAGCCCAIPSDRFDPQALLCTDPAREPLQIVRWFVQRWQVEVTFREVRDHLGVETQRQWSDRAIARTTPCLLAPVLDRDPARRPPRPPRPLGRLQPMPGTASRGRPSPTPSPLSGGSSGASRVCSCQRDSPR